MVRLFVQRSTVSCVIFLVVNLSLSTALCFCSFGGQAACGGAGYKGNSTIGDNSW